DGDTDFNGKLDIIDEVCDVVDVPVFVKEVGHGMSIDTLKRLERTKVRFINVAGAGGTSWTKIERIRNKNASDKFDEDGIPTVVSLILAKKFTTKRIIASGGIRSGIDIAKSIALGAEIGGAALPFLKAYYSNKINELVKKWKFELKAFMFTREALNLDDLKELNPVLLGRTREILYNYFSSQK
ncbi:MAG: alpha-hydroxy-acid oxidizing protein, partial [Candidatus Micrarchaeota archaeon]|nr:alpha-hydroxy-acid oxidizing protein [Candidatus Micrarchaeota archaeon]